MIIFRILYDGKRNKAISPGQWLLLKALNIRTFRFVLLFCDYTNIVPIHQFGKSFAINHDERRSTNIGIANNPCWINLYKTYSIDS